MQVVIQSICVIMFLPLEGKISLQVLQKFCKCCCAKLLLSEKSKTRRRRFIQNSRTTLSLNREDRKNVQVDNLLFF